MCMEECIRKLYPDEQEKMMQCYRAKKNCPVFVWHLEKLIHDNFPFKLQDEPREEFLQNFVEWVHLFFKNQSQKCLLSKYLKMLDAHRNFEERLCTLRFDIEPYLHIFHILKKQQSLKLAVFTNHIQSLVRQFPDDLTDFQALMYCTENSKMTNIRIKILQCIKFKGNLKLLQDNITIRKTLVPERFREIIHVFDKTPLISVYLELFNCLQIVDHRELVTLSKEHIMKNLVNATLSNRATVYRFLKKELEDIL